MDLGIVESRFGQFGHRFALVFDSARLNLKTILNLAEWSFKLDQCLLKLSQIISNIVVLNSL